MINSTDYPLKMSYHLLFRLTRTVDNLPVYFKNINVTLKLVLKHFPLLTSCTPKVIDTVIYADRVFRTYRSCKKVNDEVESDRPLVKCEEFSDDFDFIETFVTHCPKDENGKAVYLTEIDLDLHDKQSPCYSFFATPVKKLKYTEPSSSRTDTTMFELNPDSSEDEDDRYNDNLELVENNPSINDIIINFVIRKFEIDSNDIKDVHSKGNYYLVELTTKDCKFIGREHKSNHQYIVINSTSASRKCHDSDCEGKQFRKVFAEDYPKDLSKLFGNKFIFVFKLKKNFL
jgi:hypothetical protein